MQKFAFYAQLKAKPGKEDELEAFIKQGDIQTRNDPTIIRAFSMKGAVSGTYSFFDCFETEAARAEHLEGEAAKQLASVSASLLSEAPLIHLLEVVREK